MGKFAVMEKFPYRDPPPERPENHLGYVLTALVIMLVVWFGFAR